MINFTPLITWVADWVCHVRLLPHHLVSPGSSLAKAVIKSAADYSAASPGTITDWLLCHQLHAVVGFLCLTHYCGGIFVSYSGQRHVSRQGTRPPTICVSVR